MLASLGSIFYVLIGYPLIVAAAAMLVRRGGQTIPGREWLPSVAVIIAAYNEEEVVEARIENLLALDYPSEKLSIVVAADGSSDRTAELARSFEDRGVQVLDGGPRQGKSAAINRAVRSASSDILVFSDANNTYDPDGLTNLTRPFATPRIGAVTGSKRVSRSTDHIGVGESAYWRYESFLKEAESRIGSCVGVNGEMLAIRRELVVEIPEEIINDDFFLAMHVLKQGFDIAYQASAVSWEPASLSASDDGLRRQRIVAGRVQALMMAHKLVPWRRPTIAWQVISHKLLRPAIPPLAVLGLAATVLAMGTSVKRGSERILPAFALVGQVSLYVAARMGRKSNSPGPIPKVAAYLVDSNKSSFKGAMDFLRGDQDVLWEKAARRQPDVLRTS